MTTSLTKKIASVVTVLFLFSFCLLSGQTTFDVNYINTFGMAFAAGETNNQQSYYALGWNNVQPSRFYLIRTSKQGCIEMGKTFRPTGGISNHTYAYSGQQTLDGGYVMYGTCDAGSFGLSKLTLWVVKTSPSGVLQWSKTYAPNSAIGINPVLGSGGPSSFYNIYNIQQTQDSGFVFSAGYNNGSVYLYKTDKNGTLQWSKNYSTLTAGGIVKQTKDLGYILSGSKGFGQNDVVLIKVNSLGAVQWSNYYGDANNSDYPLAITETSDSGYAVCGFTKNASSNRHDMFVFKTTKNGNMHWEKEFGFAAVDEFAKDIIQNKNGDLIITGLANDSTTWSSVKYKAYLAKVDINGNFLWERKLGNGLENRGLSVKEVSTGGYIIGGFETTVVNLKVTDSNGLIGCNDHSTNTPKANTFLTGNYTPTALTQTSNIIEIDQATKTISGSSGLLRDTPNCIRNCAPLTVSRDTSICLGNSITLSASGGSCEYYWEPPTGLNTQYGKNVIANPTVTTTYTVTAEDCGLQALVTISVVPIPSLSVSQSTSVCFGDSITLTASGANTYNWVPVSGISSPTGNSINVRTRASITYTVYASTGVGCYDTATVSVNILIPASISISSNTTICNGDQSTLTVSGATSYTWSNSMTSSAINVAPTSTNSYSVTGIDANGCKNYAVTTVSVNPLPATIINGPLSVCSGSSVGLSGGGGSSYLWNTGETTSTILVSPTVHTTYTLIGSTAFGCTKSAILNINVNALPVITASASAICAGGIASISAWGLANNNYHWSNSLGVGQPVSALPTTSTSYTVTGTDNNGCSNTAIALVQVNPLPVIQVSPNNIICRGDRIALTAGGAMSYSWSNSSTSSIINVSPNTNTTYSVTGVDINGCSGSAVTTVSVSPVPTASVQGLSRICIGNATTLTASGGINYLWNNSSVLNTLTINPTSATVYTVIVSIGSCSDTASYPVDVDSLPHIVLSADTAICLGSSVALTASGSAVNYLWSPVISNSTIINVSPLATSSYSVTATDANGCKNYGVITVTVNSLPVVSISSNTTICEGNSVTLTASGGTNYLWSNLSSSSIINVSPSISTTYSVNVKDNNGCSANSSVLVNVIQHPVSSVSNDTSVCEGQSVTLYASGGTSYYWNTGALASTITVVPAPGSNKYIVNISNGACATEDSILINVFALPIVDAGNNVTINKGTSIQLNASGGIGYSWSPAVDLSCINCPNPIANPTETTTYYVTVVNENGCTKTDQVTVTIEWICSDLFIPNAFSPNDDGQNDLFRIYGSCVKEVFMEIYNQWGERIFEDSGASPYWDGTYRGEKLNSDVFAYSTKIILVTGEEIFRIGNVSLVR